MQILKENRFYYYYYYLLELLQFCEVLSKKAE